MDLQALSQVSDDYFKEVFQFLSKTTRPEYMAGDAETPIYRFRSSDIDALAEIQDRATQTRLVEKYGGFRTPREAYSDCLLKMIGDQQTPLSVSAPPNVKNRTWKWGTVADPAIYTNIDMPISFGPGEASAVYATGGLPQQIIDKKTRAMTMNGATFHSHDTKFWNGDKVEQLETAADETGLNDVAADAICDSYLYGGSVLYPVFKGESPTSFIRPLDKLNIEQGAIERWVNVDRWNITTVPSFIITAKDYLNPDTILIPQSNIELSTTRCAMLRPKSLPYWAAILNLGWCPSDLTGWIRAYYNYEITQMSVPVMAQQMSLVLYKMPLDALNATIGATAVRELMAINEEKMAEWNSLNPKAVNMVGDVEVVDRTYSGFDQFVGATKSELASQCGIPEPSLWHTPNKGFSDNTQESLLKQSETLKMNQRSIERCLNPIRDSIVAHTFGRDSKEWENRHTLKLAFDKPVISTEKDLAEVGARFAASVNSFVQAGVSPDVAINLSKPFFPSVKVTDEMIKMAKDSYEKMQATQGANKVKGSNSGAKTQAPSNRIF
jgi:hypothetical protein